MGLNSLCSMNPLLLYYELTVIHQPLENLNHVLVDERKNKQLNVFLQAELVPTSAYVMYNVMRNAGHHCCSISSTAEPVSVI